MNVKPNLWKWLVRVAFDWAIIVCCFVVTYHCVWLLPICAIVIGARQHALALMGHDATHFLVCENKTTNDLLASVLCFWPLGFQITGYRAFHLTHHQTVGSNSDPELIHKHHPLIGQWRTPLNKWKIAGLCLGDLVGGSLLHFPMLLYLTYPRKWWDPVGLVLLLGLAFAFLPWWVLGLWFGCLLTTFFACFRLRVWGEHIGAENLQGATQRISANWYERFLVFPHNTWCHYEHHKKSSIPCWALPQARKLDDSPPVKTISELIRELQ